MLTSARPSRGYAKEEVVSTLWALLSAGALLVTSRVKLPRSAKTSMSAASFLGYVKPANAPTPWEAIFVCVRVDT